MAAHLVDRHVEEGRGQRPVIRCQGKTWTYADLLAQVNRTANALTDLGLQMEQRCLLLLPDCPDFHFSFLGAMKMGAVPVPANRLAPLACCLRKAFCRPRGGGGGHTRQGKRARRVGRRGRSLRDS